MANKIIPFHFGPQAPNREEVRKTLENTLAELLGVEARMRHLCEQFTGDTRLASRLNLGADHIERAIERIRERLSTPWFAESEQ